MNSYNRLPIFAIEKAYNSINAAHAQEEEKIYNDIMEEHRLTSYASEENIDTTIVFSNLFLLNKIYIVKKHKRKLVKYLYDVRIKVSMTMFNAFLSTNLKGARWVLD